MDEDLPLEEEGLEELFLPEDLLFKEVDELDDESLLPDDVRPTFDELLFSDEDEFDDSFLFSDLELLCLPLMLDEEVVVPADGLLILLLDDDEPLLLYLPLELLALLL